MAEAPRISANDLKKRMAAGEQFTLIDTRNPQAWSESDSQAKGAIRVPFNDLENSLNRIPKDKPVVTYCT